MSWIDDEGKLLLKITHKAVMATDLESHVEGHVITDKTQSGS